MLYTYMSNSFVVFLAKRRLKLDNFSEGNGIARLPGVTYHAALQRIARTNDNAIVIEEQNYI